MALVGLHRVMMTLMKAQSAPKLLKTLLPTRGTLLPLAARHLDQVTSQPTPTLDQHSHGCRYTQRQKSVGVRDRLGLLGFSSIHGSSIPYCLTLYSALRVAILVLG